MKFCQLLKELKPLIVHCIMRHVHFRFLLKSRHAQANYKSDGTRRPMAISHFEIPMGNWASIVAVS